MVKREQKVAEALATMAHPKTWPLSNGALLEVHTPATTKYAALHCLLWRSLYSMTGCLICVEGNDARKCSCSFVAA